MTKTNKRTWEHVKDNFPRAKTPVIGCYLTEDLTSEVAWVVWYDWNYGGDKPIWENPITAKVVDVRYWIRHEQWKRFPKPPVIKTRKKRAKTTIG